MNPIRRLREHGQSFWLDFIRRRSLDDGTVARMIADDGLAGITSNPTIFAKAIGGSADYDRQLGELLAADPRRPAGELFERLAIEDIRAATDLLAPVYRDTGGADGYVSLEVSPYLAYDTAGTEAEVRRLWGEVDRPNLMVKVPATPEGVAAIETLTGEGINVNVTLMFSLAHYEAVAAAYVAGLERLAARGDDAALRRVASVASFFVSRVDSKVDPRLEAIGTPEALALRGTVAIANSKLAWRRFREIFHGPRFAALAARGARRQRVLWGSTSTKNEAYSDVLYVEELIGPETVNTIPPATVDAYRDHGEPADRLGSGMEEAAARIDTLARLGVDLDEITEDLQREGVAAFADSYDELLATLETKRRALVARGAAGRQQVSLGRSLGAVGQRLDGWQDARVGRRLWSHDRTLWSAEPVPELLDRLGWLDLPENQRPAVAGWNDFAAEVAADSDRVVLLGMGGSSLAPEVFARVFGRVAGRPELSVLDSTHPAAVAATAAGLDLARTLFVVSSKSGTTTETLSLFRYFWERVGAEVEGGAGERFVAVTDPGSALAKLGRERGFRRVFTAPPEVGGRYSALSAFGLVPAALAGVDVGALLDRAWAASFAFGPERPARVNEALVLGAALGVLAAAGRDKLTFLTSAALAAFPDWIEQLVAESTGKRGRGILPVVGETAEDAAGAAADDRLWVGITLAGDDGTAAVEERLAALERAGAPVVRTRLRERADLGGEMLRWELAVAAAGIALGIQPFDQPDVQLAKDLARQAIAGGGDGAAPALAAADGALPAALGELLDGSSPGDYVAVQAYLAPTAATDHALASLAGALRRRTGRAVTVGYGPRFLHSTGQLHKGGPEGGRFLQLVDRPAEDVAVPESDVTFGRLIRGQAAGDRQALAQRGRPVLAIDLGADPGAGLERLVATVGAAAGAAV